MKYDMPAIRKMNEFPGRDRDTSMAREPADTTYPKWRKAIAAEDDRGFADAPKSAPCGSHAVEDTRDIFGHIMIRTRESRQAMARTRGREEPKGHTVRAETYIG